MSFSNFIWNPLKNQSNIAKHKISFEEAATVFDDPNAAVFYDNRNSIAEDRFIAIGLSEKSRVLYVCHCHRDGDYIRIISARKASKRDMLLYGGGG